MRHWTQQGRPPHIPKDIWEKAIDATSVLPTAYGWRKITEAVAMAILAERDAHMAGKEQLTLMICALTQLCDDNGLREKARAVVMEESRK